jgi:imidazolonepropionase-like amidohydrolase
MDEAGVDAGSEAVRAAVLEMEKGPGAVAPGFFADNVTVEGDPLVNVTAIWKRENVRWVMKAGQTVVDKTKPYGK